MSRATVERFLIHEAELLDQGRWQEWGALFTEDGEYWIPATPGQPDPLSHVSHVYEDRLLRAVRIERFADPNAFSLQPMPRRSHLMSSVVVEATDPATGELTVGSRFVVVQLHREQQTLFAGRFLHRLVPDGESFRIRGKRVDLLNCDAPLGDVVVYL